MSNTLTYTDTIQRVGYTTIDGVKVAQHVCILPLENPKGMRTSMTKMNAELYELNRDICRKDFADFEDAAYQLRDEYLQKVSD